MEETIKWAQMLRDSPDLFPWVCLALFMVIIFSQRNRIFAYFDARIESHKERERFDNIMTELIRNNTAALENNTAALESVKQDRGESRRMIQHHEDISRERIETVRDDLAHIQTVVNRIDDNVNQNNKIMTVLKERG